MRTQKQKFHGGGESVRILLFSIWAMMMTLSLQPTVEKFTSTVKFQVYINIFTCNVEHNAHTHTHTDTFKLQHIHPAW